MESLEESRNKESSEVDSKNYEFKTYVYKEVRDQINEIAEIRNMKISLLIEQEIRLSLEEGLKGYVKKRNVKRGERKLDKTCKIVVYLNYDLHKRIENLKSRIRSKSDYLEWIVKRIIKNYNKEIRKNEKQKTNRNRRSC